MGYLDNSTIVVDAVLTKEGRKKLAAGGGLDISFFTLSDSGVDYRLWNPDHPSGSAFYGEAIENLPSLEAIPRAEFYMRNKLITLDKNVSALPYWSLGSNGDDLETNAIINITDTEDPNQGTSAAPQYDGVTKRFTFNQAAAGTSLLIIANNNMFESIGSDANLGDSTIITPTTSYEGLTYNSLVNLEAQEPMLYDLPATTNGVFNINFKRNNLTTQTECDATIIDVSTGIFKSFKIIVGTKA